MTYDAIVIGAGAAGLFCALTAGQRGRRVVVLEHNAEPGRKIVISGGGRCNFTNLTVTAENFVSGNPHFAKSALARYTPDDFIKLVRNHRIEYYEKTLGQLFCRDSSRQIVGMLLEECRRGRVAVRTGCRVSSVRHDGSCFVIETSDGTLRGSKLVVATGGLSFPKIGATGIGYEIARKFGHRVTDTRPSLVPLVLSQNAGYGKLAGVATEAIVRIGKRSFRENILFTHRGLSGPAVLQISNYWSKEAAIEFDLMPDQEVAELLKSAQGSSRNVTNFLSQYLPARLVEQLMPEKYGRSPVSALSPKSVQTIGERINQLNLSFNDTEGWHKAEVTRGGVETSELSSQTMESKKLAGLFFIGEVVDVTGWLGGYNFQWAWASGFAAGESL